MSQKKRLKAEAKAEKKQLKLNQSSSDTAERATKAAEKNVQLRLWQLVVAIIAAAAVTYGVLWRIFG